MGTLLKWTTGTGRDMSFLFDSDDKTHRAKRIIAGSVRLGCAPEINPFS